jgi:hypothetical protein
MKTQNTAETRHQSSQSNEQRTSDTNNGLGHAKSCQSQEAEPLKATNPEPAYSAWWNSQAAFEASTMARQHQQSSQREQEASRSVKVTQPGLRLPQNAQ